MAEITHEIKNPLMMIGGFSHQLLDKAGDEKTRRKLGVIVDEVARLENLLGDLRAIYLPRPLQIEDVDLVSLLQEVLDLVREDCRRATIAIRAEWGERVRVPGDRDRLKQVFLNLAKNAVEAMPRGGTLDVRARLAGERAEISIRDTGGGIPPGDREKIFSPFHTTKKAGTGLGLNVSKRILEDHAGSRIRFSSEEGRGTRFEISMPLVTESRNTTGGGVT